MLSGFFQIRNANGEESLPQEALIINRNTFDYNFNSALNPVVHIGNASLAFNTGMQFTIRRDTEAPQYMNQNLFREFAVRQQQLVRQLAVVQWRPLSRSRSVHGYQLPSEFQRCRQLAAIYRWDVPGARPHSSPDTPGAISRSVRCRGSIFTTSTYGGLQHKFGQKLTASLLGEYIRS